MDWIDWLLKIGIVGTFVVFGVMVFLIGCKKRGDVAKPGDQRSARSGKKDRPTDVAGVEQSVRIAEAVLEELAPLVVEGAVLTDIDRRCKELIESRDAVPALLGYRGFHASITIARDNIVCNAPPKPGETVKDGDLLTIQTSVFKDGSYGTADRKYAVGSVAEELLTQQRVTEECAKKAIEVIKAGVKTGDVGAAIQELAEANGYSVIRSFTGYGIGPYLHHAPELPNFGQAGRGQVLQAGQCLVIMPMLTAGEYNVKILADGRTALTIDGKPATSAVVVVAVTRDGVRVLSSKRP